MLQLYYFTCILRIDIPIIKMRNKCLLFYLFLYLLHGLKIYATESVYYMNIERPVVTYYNKMYLNDVRVSSRRISRQDPRYFLSIYYDIIVIGGNNITLDFYFHQFLTNRYRPSFVEIHTRWCDFVDKDSFLGTELKKNLVKMNMSCPLPPGAYNLTDMTVPFIPKNFPFSKGRIYTNLSLIAQSKTTPFAEGYIDMEIKQWNRNRKNP